MTALSIVAQPLPSCAASRRAALAGAAFAAFAAAAALTACASPSAHTGADLAILPARDADWRIVVGHWEKQVELTGESVVVPPPQAEYARQSHLSASATSADGRREALQFEWKDLWQATLRVESRQPLDLRPYLGGTLEFDLEVTDLAKGGVKAGMSCGNGCERSVNLVAPARAWAGKGWQHVALAMSCFQREGTDLSKVKLPFALEASGAGHVGVSNVRITREARATLPCPDYRTESTTPAVQEEAWAIDWWQSRHQELLAEKRQLLASGHPPEIVFIGDSITQGWRESGHEVWQQHYAGYHALNLGIGGDRTENVLWRLQHGELDGLAPKVAVLMIGTNNTGQRAEAPATTAAGVARLVDEIRQRLPGTKVLLLAVFPRGEKPDDYLRGLNDQVNRIIAGQADGRRVFFLDINASLMGADGTVSKDILPDLLHPNAKGYAIWQRAMDPTLQKLLRLP